MFSTDYKFRQQENLVDNQKYQAEFRPLCNKILLDSNTCMSYLTPLLSIKQIKGRGSPYCRKAAVAYFNMQLYCIYERTDNWPPEVIEIIGICSSKPMNNIDEDLSTYCHNELKSFLKWNCLFVCFYKGLRKYN